MHRLTSATVADLFDVAATRRIEQLAASTLPPHTLMQRAGLAVARLAMALAPHARTVWIACGPGNNGGDGLEAAAQLRQRGFVPVVTWRGAEGRASADALASLQRARAAGVQFADAPPERFDLVIDALLGIGAVRPPDGALADWLARMAAGAAPILSVDLPSGLDADTGVWSTGSSASLRHPAGTAARFCLSLLTLKPGLFTGQGRDAAGEVWFDDLGVAAPAGAMLAAPDAAPAAGSAADPDGAAEAMPIACLAGAPAPPARLHASHKGSYGDVAVIGGAPGMTGAALLAASAALHAGAGRVFVGLLDPQAGGFDPSHPELMWRDPAMLDWGAMTVVCGCGAGTAIRALLPRILLSAQRLVLDADALNAIALDASLQALLEARGRRGRPTVLTPHPLEAARLLNIDTASVQADRLRAARRLAERFGAVVVLKGSGSVVTAPQGLPSINLSGNARLACAGTGDVLAGMVGAALAAGRSASLSALDAARTAVWRHGDLADRWPADLPLTAGALARGAVQA